MFEIIIGLLGGLALFLFGLQALGSSLQEMAGQRAQKVLGYFTSVPVVGMLVGTGVTFVVQSSTLVTVMVVSLVNSTLLNLKQAASVIMGANIGTTFTAQMISFNIMGIWVYSAILGILIRFFARQKSFKTVGHALFGFGVLLLGLTFMVDAMRPLRDDPAFQDFILRFGSNRILLLLIGMVLTAVIQSSTAVTSIIVAMTMTEAIGLDAALPLILGANIGTCFTAVIASFGGTISAKRAAAVHVLFNTFGAIVFLIFLPQFKLAVLAVSPYYDVGRQAANAHTMFSVISTILFLPFINQLVKLVTLIVPERKAVTVPEKDTVFLNWNVVTMPAVAIDLAQKELLRMGDLAGQNVRLAIEGFVMQKKKKLKQMKRQEKLVDKLEKEIVRYLAAVSQRPMSKHLSVRHTGLLHAANDIERVSDHAQNIAKLAKSVIDNDIELPRSVFMEIEAMYEPVAEIFETAIESVRKNDPTFAPKIKELEKQIDAKEKEMRSAHIKRIAEGEFSAEAGIIFLDILSNFERISDHSLNISHLPQGRL